MPRQRRPIKDSRRGRPANEKSFDTMPIHGYLTVTILSGAAQLLELIRKFSHLPSRDQRLFMFVYVLLGLIRISLLCLPFKLVAKRLGAMEHRTIPVASPGISDQKLFRDLVQVIELASKHTPWQSKCLVQSICLVFLLNRCRIPYMLCIGMLQSASPGNQKTLAAHAWVTAGEQIASWNSDHSEYAPVCRFVSRRIVMSTSLQVPSP